MKPSDVRKLTAKGFMDLLEQRRSDTELEKIQRYFKTDEGEYSAGDKFMGVRMGEVFSIAKEFVAMPVTEIEKMLENPIHEMRAGAVSVMDKISRNKKTDECRRKEIFDLYVSRHDRVNNWDLVDLGCLHMTGSYLFNKPRKVLYKWAKSKSQWERRSAIVSTTYFIRHADLDDTFKISELLLHDREPLVHKATGWMLRFAGDKDRKRLIKFLDLYAAEMPRILLRNCLEKFEKCDREHYLNLKT